MSPSRTQNKAQNKQGAPPPPEPAPEQAAPSPAGGSNSAAPVADPNATGDAEVEQQAINEDAGPIYVSYREVKGAPAHTTKYNRKVVYVKHFYLIDVHGSETLAASGEDQGDAHYIYRNVDTFTRFGTLDCHNRKELVAWLDRIRRESQEAANFHLIEDPPETILAASPVGSPMRSPTHAPFVAYRQEKFEFPDGHRGQKWFLVDESGHEQLAVSAEERDTRDGHYTYKAEGPLAQLHPDIASNMSVVSQWLDGVVVHPDKPHTEGSSPRQAERARAHHTPANMAKPKASHQHSQPKRYSHKRDSFLSGEQRHHKLQDNSEASIRSEAIQLLRHKAEVQSRRQNAVCQAALDWLQAEPSEEQVQHVEVWMGRLQEDLSKLAAAKDGVQAMDLDSTEGGSASSAAPPRIAALVDALEALREIGATHFTNELMHRSQVVKCVQDLRSHAEKSIADLATLNLRQLQVLTRRHVAVLIDPEMVKSPVAETEELIRAMDAKVASRPAQESKGVIAQAGLQTSVLAPTQGGSQQGAQARNEDLPAGSARQAIGPASADARQTIVG